MAPEEPVLGIPLLPLCMSRHIKVLVLPVVSPAPQYLQLITAILEAGASHAAVTQVRDQVPRVRAG